MKRTLSLVGVTDTPIVESEPRPLAINVNLTIPPGHYILLAQNLKLRKPAIDLLAKLRPPKAGAVQFEGVCSWPIGRPGFMRGVLNGYQIIDLVARLYQLDREMAYWAAEEMLTEPGRLSDPMTKWPASERAELGHILSLLPRFDVYVVDGQLPFRKDRFTELWRPLFTRRIEGRTLILAATRASDALEFCDAALVLHHGQFYIESQIERLLDEFPVRSLPSERVESAEPVSDDFDDV